MGQNAHVGCVSDGVDIWIFVCRMHFCPACRARISVSPFGQTNSYSNSPSLNHSDEKLKYIFLCCEHSKVFVMGCFFILHEQWFVYGEFNDIFCARATLKPYYTLKVRNKKTEIFGTTASLPPLRKRSSIT
ncbi:MAG: hypothetical protein Ta2B_13460 [Termitinemataceae bacterium]|nr:MAG: hypothetical protein Ta2B_13460 [Termitinemataceae bacterium]